MVAKVVEKMGQGILYKRCLTGVERALKSSLSGTCTTKWTNTIHQSEHDGEMQIQLLAENDIFMHVLKKQVFQLKAVKGKHRKATDCGI